MDSYNSAKKTFIEHASLFMKPTASEKLFQRRLKGTFGVSCHVGGMLLYLTMRKFGYNHCPIDKLLIGLRWLKAYHTECNDAIFFNLDEKTIRKWRRIVVVSLSSLELVSMINDSVFLFEFAILIYNNNLCLERSILRIEN